MPILREQRNLPRRSQGTVGKNFASLLPPACAMPRLHASSFSARFSATCTEAANYRQSEKSHMNHGQCQFSNLAVDGLDLRRANASQYGLWFTDAIPTIVFSTVPSAHRATLRQQ